MSGRTQADIREVRRIALGIALGVAVIAVSMFGGGYSLGRQHGTEMGEKLCARAGR